MRPGAASRTEREIPWARSATALGPAIWSGFLVMGLAGCYPWLTLSDLPGDGEPQSQTFEVHIEPTNPTTVDELAVVVDDPWEDPDGNTVTYIYAWSVDGTVSPDANDATLSADMTTRGEEWTVTVTPINGSTTGQDAIATGIIVNAPPTAPVISIAPVEPRENIDNLLCQVDTASTDSDEDPVTYSMTWTVDSVAFAGTPSTTTHTGDTIDRAATSADEQWECTATPNDGVENGATAIASATVVEPSITIPDMSLADADCYRRHDLHGDRSALAQL